MAAIAVVVYVAVVCAIVYWNHAASVVSGNKE